MRHREHQPGEDAIQETSLHIMQHSENQPGHACKRWLYTIATNIIREYFKIVVTGLALMRFY
ncbi:sigma factor [Dictyobacter alpinus]|uniref:sigma factor n=1 Tax=Dictyobacter alpinus TaxID=2014873 RepID=UPI000F82BE03